MHINLNITQGDKPIFNDKITYLHRFFLNNLVGEIVFASSVLESIYILIPESNT